MKFHIGDTVKVIGFINIDDVNGYDREYLGQTGIVVEIDTTYKYPYTITFDNKEVNRLGCEFWGEEELELVSTNKGQISDGYHTFDELYYHRMMLFAVICNTYKDKSWKSRLHHDDTMYPDYFIVGVETVEGQYTYHYHKDHWSLFDVTELRKAPEWDGHKPEDITRLLSLLK